MSWNTIFDNVKSGLWIVVVIILILLWKSDIVGHIINFLKWRADKTTIQRKNLEQEEAKKREKQEKEKLEYSKTLVNENLSFRANTKIGFDFVECDLRLQIKDLPTTEDYTMYSDDIDAYLKSGYENVWGIYENIESLIKQHDAKAQQFAIDLKSKIMSELKQKIPKIMEWNTVGKPPAKYFTEHLLNQVVCSVIWFYEHPIDKDRIHNVFIVVYRNNRWQIDRDYLLFGSDNEIETREIQQMIIETIDTALRSKDFSNLKDCFENVEAEHERFVKEIRKIIKDVKRGIPLKGECETDKKVN